MCTEAPIVQPAPEDIVAPGDVASEDQKPKDQKPEERDLPDGPNGAPGDSVLGDRLEGGEVAPSSVLGNSLTRGGESVLGDRLSASPSERGSTAGAILPFTGNGSFVLLLLLIGSALVAAGVFALAIPVGMGEAASVSMSWPTATRPATRRQGTPAFRPKRL